jgi:hypothetical protein
MLSADAATIHADNRRFVGFTSAEQLRVRFASAEWRIYGVMRCLILEQKSHTARRNRTCSSDGISVGLNLKYLRVKYVVAWLHPRWVYVDLLHYGRLKPRQYIHD